MPTQELYPQLENAFNEICDGNFRMMFDDVRPEIIRPVLYEPAFFDENDELTSQKIIYTASVASKPKSAQQAMDRVAHAIELTDTASNPVKYAIEEQAAFPDDEPDFLREILAKVDVQTANTARVIGGLLMVKDAYKSTVGLRFVYNRALMDVSTTWELRELAMETGEAYGPGADGIKTRNPNDLGDVAVRMALHCLQASRKLKPTLIFAPALGFRNM